MNRPRKGAGERKLAPAPPGDVYNLILSPQPGSAIVIQS